MKRMFSITVVVGLALCLAGCDSIYDDPNETGKVSSWTQSFTAVDATRYDRWVYLSLAGGTAETVLISDGPEAVPAEWDLALHRYDVKTNGGRVYNTGYSSLSDFNRDVLNQAYVFPADNRYTADIFTESTVAIDMSGMMQGNIVYTPSFYNEVLSGWLRVDTSQMPPNYIPSGKVYLLKLADGTVAAIRLTDFMKASVKGYMSFDYIYPLSLY